MIVQDVPSRRPPTGASLRTAVALAVGVLVLVVGAAMLLAESSPRPAGLNRVRIHDLLQRTTGAPVTLCQGREVLYRGATSIRVSLASPRQPGPDVRLIATSHGRELTAGRQAAGWSGDAVTIPIPRVERTTGNVRVCLSLARGNAVELRGGPVDRGSRREATLHGRPIDGRVQMAYLRPGSESWWSYATTVAHRMGLSRAWPGVWVAFVVGALMLAAAGLAVTRLARDTIPGAGWACALVACFSATAWSLITPPLQVPDEPDHYAYVQYLGETGKLPSTRPRGYSRETYRAMALMRFGDPATRNHAGLWSSVEQRELDRGLGAHPSRRGTGPGGASVWEPPLYYALEAVPYRIGLGGSLLDRIALMRLLSALMAGVTALLVFLFVREALPREPWAWTVGGLGFALQPLFGFMSGGVNADSLLFLSSAALFYCLARAFRRGLSTRLALAIGAVLALGMLSKLAFAGLVPGALLGVLACALRSSPSSKLGALRLSATAGGVALVPIGLMMVANIAAFGRPAIGAASGAGQYLSSAGGHHGSLLGFANFTWQFYLPPLPFTPHDFPGVFTTRAMWLNGFIGLAGWSAIVHPDWVYTLIPIPASIILVLAARALLHGRADVRARAVELLAYSLMGIGLAAEIGTVFYGEFLAGASFVGQSRYLLPLAAPFAAVLALAARGAGSRWGPASGALIVLLVLGLDLGTQLLVISKWYG